jgi:glycosyltransferase involved in cell wall biosynthesis
MAPFYRARQTTARWIQKGRRLARPPVISQAKLKRFRSEMDRGPRTSLPLEPPRSLAVVVPCFKHAPYLPQMFESLVAQTRPPDEAIFIDDGSPDDSSEVIRRLFATHPSPRGGHYSLLVNDRNLGQAVSLNRAISTASSDLIMILNDDDYLMHDAVESMLALFGRYRDVALIGAHSVHFEGNEMLAGAQKVSTAYAEPGLPLVVHRPEDVLGYRNYNDLNMTHSGSTFLKVAWEAVGGYQVDKKRRVVPFSDRDFQLRVSAAWPVAVACETPYSFWRTDSSVDRDLDS